MRRIPGRDFKVDVKRAVYLEVNAALYVGRVVHLASPPLPGPRVQDTAPAPAAEKSEIGNQQS